MFPKRYTLLCAEVLPILKLNFKPVELLARKVGTAGEVASLMLVVALGLTVPNLRKC
jgi:hypothetical protein